MIRFVFVHFLCLCMLSLPVQAEDGLPPLPAHPANLPKQPPAPKKSPDNEFVYQPYPGAVLIPVHVWGAVGRTGVYKIPIQTDLVTLLSIAGGPSPDAELDRLTIRRFPSAHSKQSRVMLVNAEELLRDDKPQNIPTLEANDIVHLPKQEPAISNNTVLIVTVIGSVLSIAISAFVLKELTSK